MTVIIPSGGFEIQVTTCTYRITGLCCVVASPTHSLCEIVITTRFPSSLSAASEVSEELVDKLAVGAPIFAGALACFKYYILTLVISLMSHVITAAINCMVDEEGFRDALLR